MILKKLKILVLLTVLIISFLSCKTTSEITEIPEQKELLELPKQAVMKSVKFIDQEKLGGLFISYDNYRKLESNIIEYIRYIKELEEQVYFYRGDSLGE